MRKALLGTSAIALAGAFASTAHAVDWEVKLGGYMEQYAAYASSDVDGLSGDWDGIDNKADSEIHVLPSITLDNGMKIGANFQIEGNTDGDQIDESFLFLDGSFGRVLLGSENSAGYLMTYAAPDVTFLNVNSGSLTKFVPFSGTVVGNNAAVAVGDDIFRGTLGATFIENGRNNDAQRFTYFTPRFAGFQLGVSYARDGNQDSMAQLNIDQEPLANIFDVGANYVNSFGGLDIAVSGRWGMASNELTGDDPEVWGAGLNLGYAGVTVGGSFAEQNDAGLMDGHAWDAGVAYETGPWGFSFTYLHGENVDNEGFVDVDASGGFSPGDAILGNDEEADQYLLGVNYTLAKGVALNGFGGYVNFDEDFGDAAGPNVAGGDDVDGWVVGTGIKVSF